jgi:phage gpG-like protein
VPEPIIQLRSKLPRPIRPEEIRGLIRGVIERGTLAAKHYALLNLGGRVLRRRSGRLARSVQTKVVTSGDNVTGVVASDLYYGRFQESGATPKPRRRRFMRFMVDGRQVFARRTRIPARPWLRPAVLEAGPLIEADFNQTMKRHFEEPGA